MLKYWVQRHNREVKIHIPGHLTNVGIKMSGGTSSSLIAYMLCQYKKTHRPDIKIFPMTLMINVKPYQIEYTKDIISWLQDDTGVSMEPLTTGIGNDFNSVERQEKLVRSTYEKNNLHCHFVGLVKNPPDDCFEFEDNNENPGRKSLDNNSEHQEYQEVPSFKSFRPFANIDKKGVAELYESLHLTNSLFPITRSCESWTRDISKHCGKCWWCSQRKWGFGRIE